MTATVPSLASVVPALLVGYACAAWLLPASGRLERLGLSGGLGLGLLTFGLFLAMAAGVRLTAVSALAFAAAMVVAAGWLGRRRPVERSVPGVPAGLDRRRRAALVALGLAIAGLVGASLFLGQFWPVWHWDALTEYDFRGRLMRDSGDLGVLRLGSYYASLPLMTSLGHAWVYLLGGTNPHIIYWLFYASLPVLVAVHLRDDAGDVVATSAALVVASVPILFEHSQLALTNLPFAWAISLAAIYVYRARGAERSARLATAGVLLGLATWTRSAAEPFVAGIGLWLAWRAWQEGAPRVVLVPASLIAAFYLPWKVYQAFVLRPTDDLYGSMIVWQLDAERLMRVLWYLREYMLDVGDFGAVWLMLGASVALHLYVVRRPSAALAPSAVVGWGLAAWVAQIYLGGAASVDYLATASGERLLITLVPLAVFAATVNLVEVRAFAALEASPAPAGARLEGAGSVATSPP